MLDAGSGKTDLRMAVSLWVLVSRDNLNLMLNTGSD